MKRGDLMLYQAPEHPESRYIGVVLEKHHSYVKIFWSGVITPVQDFNITDYGYWRVLNESR